MAPWLEFLLAAHVAGGLVSLIAFWVPALSRKGGPLHRKSGRLYVRAMWLVLATSVPLSAVLFLRGEWVGGTFLLYLFIITFNALYEGLRALQAKSGPAALVTRMFLVNAWATFLGGAIVLAIGLSTRIWLLVGFSLVGLLSGPSTLAFIRRPPSDPKYWYYRHFGGMIGSGIAAHIAFLNFGAQRLFPGFSLGDWGMLAWFVPLAAGLIASNRLEAHYRARFGARSDRVGALTLES